MVAILSSTMMNNLSSQVNLIPNSDFEDVKDLCWEHTNDSFVYYFQFSFYFLNAWISDIHVPYIENLDTIAYEPNYYFLYSFGTPDLYHPCLPVYLNRGSLINNKNGFQLPYNGIGYAGLAIGMGTYAPPYCSYYREFMRIELMDTLKKGQGYCFRLRYSLADKSNRVASHLGAVFSVDSFPLNSCSNIIDRTPQVYSADILCEDLDTSNWRVLEGNFVAEGKEQWLTIGWFHYLNQIYWKKTLFPEQSADSIMAYYYIDALELIECPQYGVPDYEIIPPNVISPNGDGLNDAFFIHPYLPQSCSLIIYNRWGAEVFRSANYDQTWQGTTADGKPVAEGTYFYVLQLPSGTVKKGTVSVFR
jgi:gliding motility-associated-like protein